MIIYIVGKPRNQEELEAIWGHENIVFVDTVDEYRAHRDAQLENTYAVFGVVDDALSHHTAGERINVDSIGHIGRDKSQLTAVLSKMDFRTIEARIAAHLSDKSASLIIADEAMPVLAPHFERRSKGDKHRNRRYRWS